MNAPEPIDLAMISRHDSLLLARHDCQCMGAVLEYLRATALTDDVTGIHLSAFGWRDLILRLTEVPS